MDTLQPQQTGKVRERPDWLFGLASYHYGGTNYYDSCETNGDGEGLQSKYRGTEDESGDENEDKIEDEVEDDSEDNVEDEEEDEYEDEDEDDLDWDSEAEYYVDLVGANKPGYVAIPKRVYRPENDRKCDHKECGPMECDHEEDDWWDREEENGYDYGQWCLEQVWGDCY
ncbi:hypothetical protein FGRMN_6154 [Fusarium graminum]|nr:hypothetical protein FGRMN_6154 [Fusarium graminum]